MIFKEEMKMDKIAIENEITKWGTDNPMAVALTDESLCLKLNKVLSRKQDGVCPYCRQIDCAHWTGTGWKRP